MTPEQWDIVSRVFDEAVALKAEERARFIRQECGNDEALIAEVASLLEAHDAAGGFIDEPVVENLVSEISEMPTLTGKHIGHYHIEKSIGRGGMGDVYLATDTRLDRLVAVKKLPERLAKDPLFVKRFRAEARAAATIHHANVATVFAIEDFDDRPWIAMEYVDGRTLDAVTSAEGMEISKFLEVFIQVSDALRHAHERGIIHRDIKPGNIMLTGDGVVKILDFGLAQCLDGTGTDGKSTAITQPGQILGTPSYMSPEQAQGKEVDHRTDIFSLGVVMYETLTGVRPFQGDSNAEVISNILKTEPIAATDLRPDTPRLVASLIGRCIQKRRSERPQSMQEIRTILGEARRSVRGGVSTDSFARRLYRESRSVGLWLRVAPVIVVVGLAVLAWYYFSRGTADPPISFDKMTMRRLSDTNKVGYAQISPDGKSVAFATFEDDSTRVLWIRRIDDRNALQLVPPQRVPYWGGLAISRDGGQVFYITADNTDTRGSLYRVSSLGGPSRKLAEPANDVGGISPDGERLLYVRYSQPSQIVSIRATDGGDEQVIRTAPAVEPESNNFRDPHFSSDGKSIFYIGYERRGTEEYWSLEQINLADGSVNVINKQQERIGEIAVLPEAAGVLVTASDPTSNLQQVFHISVTDGTKTRLTNDLFYYFGVSVDHTGQNVVVTQRADEQRVWVGETSDLANLRPLAQEPNARRYVDWTPDGHIVYDGYENNVSHIWLAEADGKNVQMLSTSENNDAEPAVSGDGRYIVFTSKRNGFQQVWRMDIDGNNQVLLANVDGGTYRPRFAADGETVIFEWNRYRESSLASVPVAGGPVREMFKTEEIPDSDNFYWAESPDGKTVAYSVWDKNENRMKIAVHPVGSPEQKKIFDIWPSLVFRWTPDSKAICYRERQRGYLPEMELHTLDVASGKTSRLLSGAPDSVMGLAYSRDGKRIALIRGRGTSNAVILTPTHQ